MPYFIYKVFEFRRLEKVAVYPAYKDAAAKARALRAELAGKAPCAVRIIFADNEAHAEDLLTDVRERPFDPEDT